MGRSQISDRGTCLCSNFAHATAVSLDNNRHAQFGCIHSGPRNTFTDRVIELMFDAVSAQAKARLETHAK